MRTLKNYLVSLSTLGLLALAGCGGTGTEEDTWFNGQDLATATASFANLNKFVLQPYCVKCHSDFSSATSVAKSIIPGSPSTSRIYTLVASGDMPRGSPALTSAQMALLANYINSAEAAQYPAGRAGGED